MNDTQRHVDLSSLDPKTLQHLSHLWNYGDREVYCRVRDQALQDVARKQAERQELEAAKQRLHDAPPPTFKDLANQGLLDLDGLDPATQANLRQLYRSDILAYCVELGKARIAAAERRKAAA